MMRSWRKQIVWWQVLIVYICYPGPTVAKRSLGDDYYRNPQASSEADPSFWRKESYDAINDRLNRRLNTNIAKNIIIFLGDGMGVSTVTAGRIYKGQKERHSGEEAVLYMDRFPHTSLCKTYCVDHQTTDSAASATAYLCGVKTNMGALGVTSKVKLSDCEAATEKANQVDSIMAWAQKEGKWTGIVTTDQIVGASPAAAYAHSSSRSFYSEVPDGCSAPDIAQQLIHDRPGSKFRVILGGGRQHFLPVSARPANERKVDIDNPAINGRGVRADGRNLIEEWLERHSSLNHSAAYLWNKSHLQMLHEGDYNEDYILGLFAPDTLVYAMDKILAQQSGEEIPGKGQPTLEEMTKAAINKLNQSPSGFVLFVEGARIDTAHHDNLAGYSLEEVYQFDKAIEAASCLTSEQDTLTIVTADHSHAFTINGYAPRGNDILGHAGRSVTKKAYSTLSYAAGPGALLNEEDEERFSFMNNFLQPAMVHTKKGVHAGEDVAVYAKGPWAHLFSGTHDNTFIPHALAYAACIGLRTEHCDPRRSLSRYAHAPLREVRDLGDIVKATASAPSNLTMIDHINGQTIAPDVLKTPPPPILAPPQNIRHQQRFEPRPSVAAQIPQDVDVLVSRQSTAPAFDTSARALSQDGAAPAFDTGARDLQNPSNRLGDVSRSRVVRKVVRRTNPFNAPAQLYQQQQNIMLNPQSAANM